ncbi:hypothetical protein LB05_24145 [Salmonella enterica]|nr:hypothetical protein [Salmonella enterica]
MKKSWFHYPNCTTEEAEKLMATYRRRGVRVERSLNFDCLTWTISALLPESARAPRLSRTYQQSFWR